ncbi:CRISPR-associated protein Cas1 [Pasteurellaceae bacterium LFhippo2]|nr:CRISPR-associated protein Cas1 [Pasteurellaceae bacterium LFhippo2]
MASLYIDRKCTTLKLSNDVLICYENQERIATIPLAPIDRIYLKGGINIEASLLAKLGERNIGVIFLAGRKNTPTMFMPQPHNDAERRLMQYQLASDINFCLPFAQNLIVSKLVAQKAFLESYSATIPNLEEKLTQFNQLIHKIQNQRSLASLRGIEGKAGAIYFECLADILPSELKFDGRNRRPPRDPFNSLLSLGYTLLHAESVNALYAAGLDPYISFYHAVDFGRESLACDVMEPIRPLFDQWLTTAFEQQLFKIDDFSYTNEGCLLNKAGRVVFYSEFEKIAETWRKILNRYCYELATKIKQSGINIRPQQRDSVEIPLTNPINFDQYALAQQANLM